MKALVLTFVEHLHAAGHGKMYVASPSTAAEVLPQMHVITSAPSAFSTTSHATQLAGLLLLCMMTARRVRQQCMRTCRDVEVGMNSKRATENNTSWSSEFHLVACNSMRQLLAPWLLFRSSTWSPRWCHWTTCTTPGSTGRNRLLHWQPLYKRVHHIHHQCAFACSHAGCSPPVTCCR